MLSRCARYADAAAGVHAISPAASANVPAPAVAASGAMTKAVTWVGDVGPPSDSGRSGGPLPAMRTVPVGRAALGYADATTAVPDAKRAPTALATSCGRAYPAPVTKVASATPDRK